jgi:hypothetical protein
MMTTPVTGIGQALTKSTTKFFREGKNNARCND